MLASLRHLWTHPLARRFGRAGSLARFARWQLASRLVGAPVAVPFVNDSRLLMRTGMTGATGNWYHGLFEPGEMAFVLHSLSQTDLFLDVGANVGVYCVLASGVVGARSIAVEPVPATIAALRDNLRLNGIEERVRVVPCGVSDRRGTLRFVADLDTANRVSLPGEEHRAITVPIDRLDDLCAGETPAIVKIDVEGHERAVLEGAGEMLARSTLRAVLMETNGSGSRYGVADEALFAILQGHGFTACNYDPFARRLIDPVDPLNTIFVRDRAAEERRCQTAPQYRLVNGMI